jgi:hypothetical protein
VQTEVVKGAVLSWSAKVFGTFEVGFEHPAPNVVPVSVVRPVIGLSKDPVAEDIFAITSAETSLPLPTVSGQGRSDGGYGRCGGVAQGTSCHSVLGSEDLKHPFFGTGIRDIFSRHAFRLSADGGVTFASAAVGTDAGAVGGASGWAEATKGEKSPAGGSLRP